MGVGLVDSQWDDTLISKQFSLLTPPTQVTFYHVMPSGNISCLETMGCGVTKNVVSMQVVLKLKSWRSWYGDEVG